MTTNNQLQHQRTLRRSLSLSLLSAAAVGLSSSSPSLDSLFTTTPSSSSSSFNLFPPTFFADATPLPQSEQQSPRVWESANANAAKSVASLLDGLVAINAMLPQCPLSVYGDTASEGEAGAPCMTDADCLRSCISGRCSTLENKQSPPCAFNHDAEVYAKAKKERADAIAAGIPVFAPTEDEVAPSFVEEPAPGFVPEAPPTTTDAPVPPPPAATTNAPAPPPPAPARNPEPRPQTSVGPLTECQYTLLLRFTSIFETSNPNLGFGECAITQDGQGVSAGFVQFTSSSGALLDVIRRYTRLQPQNSLSQYIPALEQAQRVGNQGRTTGTGYIQGFENICGPFRDAASDGSFRKAQLDAVQHGYFAPALKFAEEYGLRTPLAIGQVYDTCIQLGVGAVPEIARNAGRLPKDGGDEGEWLRNYLWARDQRLDRMGGAYAGTKYRQRSYRFALDRGYLDFQRNLRVLENGGGETELRC
ncbi:hypothetical protein HDV05_006156 [Chytridiales sp. JEL 0842]|nr:hypothetical protein HDV05_006156 [Chytridiales sp. JEL 0842]